MATWDETAKVLVEHADADWDGIWTLTYAAGRATADLGVVAPMADAVELTYAAMDLCQAREELEWVRPDLPARCPAVTVGPPDPADAEVARNAIGRLITAALARAAALLGCDLDLADLACLTRTTTQLRSARRAVHGIAGRASTNRGRS
jgi:hypothetical protein